MLPRHHTTIHSKGSPAVVKVRQKLASGEHIVQEQPKDVLMLDSVFQEHELENFRTCYNKIKKAFNGTSDKGIISNVSFLLIILMKC